MHACRLAMKRCDYSRDRSVKSIYSYILNIHCMFLHVKELCEHLHILAYGHTCIRCMLTICSLYNVVLVYASKFYSSTLRIEVSNSLLGENDTSQNAMRFNLLYVRAIPSVVTCAPSLRWLTGMWSNPVIPCWCKASRTI